MRVGAVIRPGDIWMNVCYQGDLRAIIAPQLVVWNGKRRRNAGRSAIGTEIERIAHRGQFVRPRAVLNDFYRVIAVRINICHPDCVHSIAAPKLSAATLVKSGEVKRAVEDGE